MRRILLTIIISLVLATPALADEYKCAAELYPEAAKAGSFMKLGESVTYEGITYRVVAEAKDPDQELWLQFIDTDYALDTSLDGKCDFVMQVLLIDGIMYAGKPFLCDEIMEQLSQYCASRGIELEAFIHKATKTIKSNYEGDAI